MGLGLGLGCGLSEEIIRGALGGHAPMGQSSGPLNVKVPAPVGSISVEGLKGKNKLNGPGLCKSLRRAWKETV